MSGSYLRFPTVLPETGANTFGLVVVALVIIGFGWILVRSAKNRQRVK